MLHTSGHAQGQAAVHTAHQDSHLQLSFSHTGTIVIV